MSIERSRGLGAQTPSGLVGGRLARRSLVLVALVAAAQAGCGSASPSGPDAATPGDGAVPSDSAVPGDGAMPNDGATPSDGATPIDGDTPEDASVPVDAGPPPGLSFEDPIVLSGDQGEVSLVDEPHYYRFTVTDAPALGNGGNGKHVSFELSSASAGTVEWALYNLAGDELRGASASFVGGTLSFEWWLGGAVEGTDYILVLNTTAGALDADLALTFDDDDVAACAGLAGVTVPASVDTDLVLGESVVLTFCRNAVGYDPHRFPINLVSASGVRLALEVLNRYQDNGVAFSEVFFGSRRHPDGAERYTAGMGVSLGGTHELVQTLDAGDHYLAATPTQPGILQVRVSATAVTPCADDAADFAPNDDDFWDGAITVSGSSFGGTLCGGDWDYRAITVGVGDTLQVSLASSNQQVRGRIYAPSGQACGAVFFANSVAGACTATQTGVYRVQVTSGDGREYTGTRTITGP